MDVRSTLASLTYTQARPATRPGGAEQAAGNAEGGFAAALGSFADTLRTGEETAKAAMTGRAEVAMRCEIAGCVVFSFRAAPPKLPSVTTQRNVSIDLKSTINPLHHH